jgi:biopolymer transport protein ExbB
MIKVLLQGGPLVLVLLALGAIGLLVFLERLLHLHRAKIRSEDFLEGLFRNLQYGHVEEGLKICDETPGPVAYLGKTAILHRDNEPEAFKRALDNAGRAEISRMERRLAVLATTAQLSPLIGLLGTVLGLVRALLVMNQRGPLVQFADLSGWLMQALVTTALGLLVAIPAYGGYNLLVNKVEKIVLDMERAASEITAFFQSAKARPGGSRE